MARRIPDASHMVAKRADVEWSEDDFGRVEIRKPRLGKGRRTILRAAGVSPSLTVRLEPLGSEVWKLLDGRRTVGEVLAALRAAHPEEEDLRQRLSEYLSALVGHGLVELS